MRLPELGTHRSALATAGAIAAVVAVVTGVAVVSGGYAAQRVDLGDAAVWVVNDGRQAVGRANTAVLELNSVVETGGAAAEVVQQGSTVLVLDRDRATVGIVDATTSTVTKSVAVPPEDTAVALAGDRVVVAAGGDVWSTPVDAFTEFDGDADPVLTFGAGAVTSVDPAGVLFAYTPSTGRVARVDAADEETVAARWQLPPAEDDADVQITSVDEHWVVLDTTARTLWVEGREVDLAGVLEPTDDPILQAPSLEGGSVAIAYRRGLLSIGLDGGAPVVLADDVSGDPSAPIQHDGCLNAAWPREAMRACPGEEPTRVELAEATGAGALDFLVNGDALVLNDPRSGKTWAASDDYGLIDNWDALLANERDDETIEQNDPETEPTIEKTQVPPVAVDDEFGARPGRSTLLPVLLNDYDANGDVLVVDGVDGELPPGARIDLVSNNQQLQLTLDDAASGSIAFGYTVGDGRGGATHAGVTVTVRDPEDELAARAAAREPRRGRERRARHDGGARRLGRPRRGSVLPGLRLRARVPTSCRRPRRAPSCSTSTAAKARPGASRSWSPTVATRPAACSRSRCARRATCRSSPSPSSPSRPPARRSGSIRCGTCAAGPGSIRLSAVPAKPDVQLTPDFDAGSFRFTSAAVRTHYLEYTVTDGTRTATGTVRVDVSAPPDRDTTPITVPHTAFLRLAAARRRRRARDRHRPDRRRAHRDGHRRPRRGRGGARRDRRPPHPAGHPHATARDGVDDLRLPGEQRPRRGGGRGDGRRGAAARAVPAPGRGTRHRSPRARATWSTSACSTTTSTPTRWQLTLAPELLEDPAGGLLFATGDRLRYFAPEEAGEFDATYRVEASDGQFATANVHISVRDADPETNSAPVPQTVTARVIAGETVRIPIPLGGADPDGDSVQLLGQESSPERGAVVSRGGDWLEYEAGEYSAGTDTFQYAVVDALGARATGSVRVGIAPRLDGARAPIAVEDTITVRPGRTIAVRVLANDSDPDGGALTLRSVEANGPDATATVEGDTVQVEVPDHEGDFGFIYEVENEALGTASSFLTVVRTRRRAARTTRGVRHGAHAERHPRRGLRRRRGAAQRVPGRRQRRRPRRPARRGLRPRRAGASRRQHPRRRRGSSSDHPVRGPPPRGPHGHGVRVHLGARP